MQTAVCSSNAKMIQKANVSLSASISSGSGRFVLLLKRWPRCTEQEVPVRINKNFHRSAEPRFFLKQQTVKQSDLWPLLLCVFRMLTMFRFIIQESWSSWRTCKVQSSEIQTVTFPAEEQTETCRPLQAWGRVTARGTGAPCCSATPC